MCDARSGPLFVVVSTANDDDELNYDRGREEMIEREREGSC